MTLEEFVDESLRRSAAIGYHPTAFMAMWARDRSSGPIERWVISSDPKAGYRRMVKAGLQDWTLEAAVMKYPERFTPKARIYAEARLSGSLDA